MGFSRDGITRKKGKLTKKTSRGADRALDSR
jgi:hypothetical protein